MPKTVTPPLQARDLPGAGLGLGSRTGVTVTIGQPPPGLPPPNPSQIRSDSESLRLGPKPPHWQAGPGPGVRQTVTGRLAVTRQGLRYPDPCSELGSAAAASLSAAPPTRTVAAAAPGRCRIMIPWPGSRVRARALPGRPRPIARGHEPDTESD